MRQIPIEKKVILMRLEGSGFRYVRDKEGLETWERIHAKKFTQEELRETDIDVCSYKFYHCEF